MFSSLGIDQQSLLLCLLVVLFLCLGHGTELVIPLRFQAIGNETIIGIDLHVATAREFSLVLCPLNVAPAQRVGFGHSCLNFLLNSEGNLQRHRLHEFQQEITNRLINHTTGHALTDFLRIPDGGFLADIGGDHMLVRRAVMDAHPLSANTAYYAALQKRWALSCRPGFPCSSEPQCVLGEAFLIHLKLIPGDVADVDSGNHELPFRPLNFGRAVLTVRQKTGAAPTVDECAGIAGVMQHLEDSGMRRKHPMQLTLV